MTKTLRIRPYEEDIDVEEIYITVHSEEELNVLKILALNDYLLFDEPMTTNEYDTQNFKI